MQRNKKFKILEDDDEDYIPTGSSGSVQFPKPSTSNNSPALSKAKSAPLSSIASSSSSGAHLKKAKTGISAPKKRKHVAITSEDDSVLDTEAGGRPESGKEPKNWREVISLIEEAREGIVAPVDEVGAEALGDWDAVERGEIEPKVARFRTLLSLMLSSQTKDPVTANAMKNLNKRFAPLSVTTMLGASEADIDECINKVGFHNKKSVFIKETVAILHKRYNDDVPSTIAEITELPGVGPKMGFLLMQIAWKSIIGIAVDTHVHRITNRYGHRSMNGQLLFEKRTSNSFYYYYSAQSWMGRLQDA